MKPPDENSSMVRTTGETEIPSQITGKGWLQSSGRQLLEVDELTTSGRGILPQAQVAQENNEEARERGKCEPRNTTLPPR